MAKVCSEAQATWSKVRQLRLTDKHPLPSSTIWPLCAKVSELPQQKYRQRSRQGQAQEGHSNAQSRRTRAQEVDTDAQKVMIMRFIRAEVHEHIAWGIIALTLLLSLSAVVSTTTLLWSLLGVFVGLQAVLWTGRGKGNGH
jgi:hypothetical protein